MAGRLQSLSVERASTASSLARLTQERTSINGRRISDKSLNDIKTRRARLEDVRQKLSALAEPTQLGFSYLTAAADKTRLLDALRSQDRRLTNFRESLRTISDQLGIKEVDLNAAPNSTIATFRTLIAQQEASWTGRQSNRRQAVAELGVVAQLRAKQETIQKGLADRRQKLARLSDAKDEADRRIAIARSLAHKGREIRTSIVRRVFNNSLNLVWRDLFVRLAPEEPFVPAFAIPASAEGPVEALLETIYKSGGKGGNPRAMLSAGNLNTAALTLFLSLHLSVTPVLPWLVIDDPVQSMDEVHIAQFSALLRTLSKSHGRQIILAVHEKSLFDYLALELSPAYSDDRLITIELGQSSEGKTICKYEPLTWSPDPAFEAA
jgi:DNA repair protein SbcC/Rad50